MRLFTAVELSDPARGALVAEQKRVSSRLGKAGSLRLVGPEHLHLTVVFIGQVDDELGAAIVDAMQRNLPMAPFRLAFGGLGAFPARGAPRILYIDTLEGRDLAISLQRLVSERLQTLGVAPEGRSYHPHLTLGRWRDSRPSDRPRDESGGAITELEVEAVTLFQSRLSSKGPAYTRLAAARLVCP